MTGSVIEANKMPTKRNYRQEAKAKIYHAITSPSWCLSNTFQCVQRMPLCQATYCALKMERTVLPFAWSK